MPPFDTRLRAADLEWASLAFICFYAPAASIQRAPLATRGLIASRQSTKGIPLVDCKRTLFRRSKTKPPVTTL